MPAQSAAVRHGLPSAFEDEVVEPAEEADADPLADDGVELPVEADVDPLSDDGVELATEIDADRLSDDRVELATEADTDRLPDDGVELPTETDADGPVDAAVDTDGLVEAGRENADDASTRLPEEEDESEPELPLPPASPRRLSDKVPPPHAAARTVVRPAAARMNAKRGRGRKDMSEL